MSDTAAAPSEAYRTIFIPSFDGLNLHVREWGVPYASALSVICLPGLTRTLADFDALAHALATDAQTPRRVLALDYRGRGASSYDPDPKNYNVGVELADVITIVTSLNAVPAIYIGTSRGGILTMLLAATHPQMIAGAILNDIGPVIEPAGLMRIKSYAGKTREPESFEDGATILHGLFAAQFPRVTQAEWLAAARQSWRESNGHLVPTYDVRIAETLNDVDLQQPLPAMWEQFDALSRVPLMVIRGANSDILSADTLQGMTERRADIDTIVVADEGHPPSLAEPAIIKRIARFVAAIPA